MARPSKTVVTFCLSISVHLAACYEQTPCTSAFLDGYNSYGVLGGQEFKVGNIGKGSLYVLAPFFYGIPGYFLGLFAGLSGAPDDPGVYISNLPENVRAQPLLVETFKKAFNNSYKAGEKIRNGDIVEGTNEAITPGLCGSFGDFFGASDAFFGKTGSSDNYVLGECPDAFLYGYYGYGLPGGQKIRNGKVDEGIIKVLPGFIFGIPAYFLAIGDGFSGRPQDSSRYTRSFPEAIRKQTESVETFDHSYNVNYNAGVEIGNGSFFEGINDAFTTGTCGTVGIALGLVDGISL